MSKVLYLDEANDLEDSVKCGEVFLTSIGCLEFQCTLCDGKYEGYNDYWTHVMEIHYLTRANVEFTAEDLIDTDIDSGEDNELEFRAITDDDDDDDDINAVRSSPPLSLIDSTDNNGQEQHSVDTGGSEDALLELVENEIMDELTQTGTQTDAHSNTLEKSIDSDSIAQRLRRGGRPLLTTPKFSIRNFPCKECGKKFNSNINLKAHMKRHEKNLRFKCDQCPRGFISSHELTEHKRRHNGEKPFLCSDCGNTFITSSALSGHRKRVHEQVRCLDCTFCDKSFHDKKVLRDHINAHLNKRPYVCQICEASFPRQSTLHNHRKLHENKKEYVCRICEARFNQKPGLFSHMRSKHNSET